MASKSPRTKPQPLLAVPKQKAALCGQGIDCEKGFSNLPNISVITPSLNNGPFIEQTIRSVINQNYPNLEFIVIDGGSTDETISILRNYEKELTWLSEGDRGQGHAINKGLHIASGEIVSFLNSDDLYEPGALTLVGDCFSNSPGTAWLTGKCRTIDLNGKEVQKVITWYKNIWLYINSPFVLFILNFISQPATFWRRELIQTIGYFDEDLNYTLDYDYWLRLLKVCKPEFINAYLACYRIHDNSKSYSTNFLQFLEQYKTVKRYTERRPLLVLHAIHNYFTIKYYTFLRAH